MPKIIMPKEGATEEAEKQASVKPEDVEIDDCMFGDNDEY
jgi:hypothetical protein